MARQPVTHLFVLFCLLLASCTVGQAEQQTPAADAQEKAETITVNTQQVHRHIPHSFLGINLSYFNDTDEFWEKFNLEDKVRKAGIGALRYPGGEETSFYHWEHPGVNGYEDIHDDPKVFGNPRDRGPFQVTWVDPKDWETNENFMSIDDYMKRCRALNAEPVIGLNLSCGRRFDRRAEGLDEALRLMRYCKEKGFKVKYWFLDNEPWHYEAAYTFRKNQYAEDVLYFGKAIKKEFPDAKLIVNPASSETINHFKGFKHFIETAGPVVDYIDMHWYWSWGTSSWDKWLSQTPMRSGDQWKDDWMDRPFGEDMKLICKMCSDAGFPDIRIVVLEWNIGPSDFTWDLPDAQIALMQSEMLMAFLDGGADITCLWTLLWQSSREVWPRQDRFESIITHEPPHHETASLSMMRLFSTVLDKQQVEVKHDGEQLVVIAASDDEDSAQAVLLLNKQDGARRLKIQFDRTIEGLKPTLRYIDKDHGKIVNAQIVGQSGKNITIELPALAFAALTLE